MNDPIKPIQPAQKPFKFGPGSYDKALNPRTKKKTKRRSRQLPNEDGALHKIDEYV